jgi:hypothetical protein
MTVLLHSRRLERRVNREKEITMSKFLQNSHIKAVSLPSILFGSLALIALISVAPVAPAAAQSAPAGLLRLDPPRPSNEIAQLPDVQRSKVRAAYARTRKTHLHQ